MLRFSQHDPDTLEGQLAILNSLHADEIRAAMQYANHEVALKGPTSVQDAGVMSSHYSEELGHAAKLRQAIDWLGGVPDNGLVRMAEIGPGAASGKGDVQTATGRNEMFQQDLEGEQGAIEAYTEAFYLFLVRNPMVAEILQGILADEYEHRRELTNLLA